MTNWSIKHRLIAGFAAITVAFVLLTAFAFVNLRRVAGSADRIALDALPGLQTMSHMESVTRQTLAETAEHLFASDAANKAEKRRAIAELDADLDTSWKFYEGTITLEQDRQLFTKLADSRRTFVQARDAVLALSDAMSSERAIAAYRSDLETAYEQHSREFDTLVAFNKENGERAGQEIVSAVSTAQFGLLVGALLTILGSCGIAWVIVRGTNGVLGTAISNLAEGAVQVTAAAQEVASASQGLSQGATTQAASLEQTSASMEEMASMTRRNAENAQQAALLMVDTEHAVQASNSALDALVSSMGSIQDSSGKVAKIIKTIDEIAFQTNILALNAAVEAARAGEAGMGFAVVADEVRNLAQRSARAAKDTAGLIEESITISQEGQAKVDQMASAISAITNYASKVKGLVDSVSAASKEQAQGVEQVAQALSQMEKITQENAATAEESAAASEELSAQAETTTSIVGQLSQLVGGSTHAHEAYSPRSADTTSNIAKKRPRVVSTMPTRTAPAPKPMLSAEDEFPLEDTGTFGKF